ncbi:energy-coupling factor transporter transmembrane component T family protein [Haloarcula onubensis]|uniref:Energy-coupling factor transporter transmembrane protein EcfT n=1 Tax=Haloarcula onubensis TaxID=2950539 RepID=A0ABU2FIL7_9EURY|nr:energy-coupling factor transporter transmembrane protein EcfT [Halomicroarcula sp. S3CR25-11]MDS0280605.1 energy-coupling factor transporter transmembrane protein EcfT [Halomicroarcula sp. S3CR25-11]
MLTYAPGETVAHRLDARSKLACQFGFAVAAFAGPTPRRLAVLTGLAALALLAGRLSPLSVARSYRFALVILLLSPLSALLALTPPYLDPARAVGPLLAITRVVLVLTVAAVYVRTTPVRESRAVIQRYVPGRTGQALGVGVALTFRFLPVLRRDLLSVREAIQARGGGRRSVVDRARRIAVVGLARALSRSDRLSLALRARCFAWNPTPPEMAFRRRDYPVAALGVALSCWPLVAVVP